MSVKPYVSPPAGSIRRYELAGGRMGITQYVADEGVIIAEPTIGEMCSVVWSTDLNSQESYKRLAPVIGIMPVRGWIRQENARRIVECAASKVMHDIDADPGSVKAYNLGGTDADMSWHGPGEWPGFSDRHALISLQLAEGQQRRLLEMSIGLTAIEPIRSQSTGLLDTMGEYFPKLRQA